MGAADEVELRITAEYQEALRGLKAGETAVASVASAAERTAKDLAALDTAFDRVGKASLQHTRAVHDVEAAYAKMDGAARSLVGLEAGSKRAAQAEEVHARAVKQLEAALGRRATTAERVASESARAAQKGANAEAQAYLDAEAKIARARKVRLADAGVGGGGAAGGGGGGLPIAGVGGLGGIVGGYIGFSAAREAVGAYREAAGAQAALGSASRLAGRDMAREAGDAEKLRDQLSLIRKEAQGLESAGIRFANFLGRKDEDDFIRALADLNAANGNQSDSTTIAGQIYRGEDTGFDKLGLRSYEQYYSARAKELGVTVDKIDDLARAEIRYQAVLTEGEKVRGEAARRAESDVGRLDRLIARASDAKADAGGLVVRTGSAFTSLSADGLAAWVGAGVGAALGSFFGPTGTAIGATIGAAGPGQAARIVYDLNRDTAVEYQVTDARRDVVRRQAEQRLEAEAQALRDYKPKGLYVRDEDLPEGEAKKRADESAKYRKEAEQEAARIFERADQDRRRDISSLQESKRELLSLKAELAGAQGNPLAVAAAAGAEAMRQYEQAIKDAKGEYEELIQENLRAAKEIKRKTVEEQLTNIARGISRDVEGQIAAQRTAAANAGPAGANPYIGVYEGDRLAREQFAESLKGVSDKAVRDRKQAEFDRAADESKRRQLQRLDDDSAARIEVSRGRQQAYVENKDPYGEFDKLVNDAFNVYGLAGPTVGASRDAALKRLDEIVAKDPSRALDLTGGQRDALYNYNQRQIDAETNQRLIGEALAQQTRESMDGTLKELLKYASGELEPKAPAKKANATGPIQRVKVESVVRLENNSGLPAELSGGTPDLGGQLRSEEGTYARPPWDPRPSGDGRPTF